MDLLLDSLKGVRKEFGRTVLITNEKYYPHFRKWAATSPWDIEVYSDGVRRKEDKLGAVGDLIYVLDRAKIKTDFFACTPDYVMENFDFKNFIRFAKVSSCSATIAKVEPDKGLIKAGSCLKFDKCSKVTHFEEKPKQPFSQYYGIPYYFIKRKDLETIRELPEKLRDNSGQLVKILVEKSQVACRVYEGLSIHLTTERDYQVLVRRFSAPLIVLDFDGTIYDVEKLKHDFRAVSAKYDLEFDSVYRRLSKHKPFSLDLVEKYLKIPQKDKISLIKKYRGLISQGKKYLYPDVVGLINKFPGRVAILTYGDTSFQVEKLIGTGISHLFDKVCITQKEKHLCSDFLAKAKIIVDDSPVNLFNIKKRRCKAKLYFLARNKQKLVPSGIKVIHTLKEIKNVS